MYLKDLFMIVKRRWILVVLALLLAAAGGMATYRATSPTFQTGATVVLVPPRDTGNGDQANRFLNLGSIGPFASVLAQSMRSQDVDRELRRAATEATYVVTPDTSAGAPLVSVQVTAVKASQATNLLRAVLERLPENLQQVQADAGIPDENLIGLVTVSQDGVPMEIGRGKLRYAAVVVAGLLLAFAVLISSVDSAMRRRTGLR